MPGRENADQRDHHKSRMADGPGHRGCRGITGNARAQAKAQTHPIPAEKFVRQVEKKTVRHVRHDTNSEFRVPKAFLQCTYLRAIRMESWSSGKFQ
jgi:hypothetical protein